MKKLTIALTCLLLVAVLAACGAKKEGAESASAQSSPAQSAAEQTESAWTRQGFFENENGDMLSITYSDLEGYEGWMVGLMIANDMDNSHGNILPEVDDTLHGNIIPAYEEGEMIVTVSEEGDDGVMLTVEDGAVYHFTPMDMEQLKATIFVTINTEGLGNISYAEGTETPEVDEEYPYQSAQINLKEPTTHTFLAWTKDEDWQFKKWTKNGEDFAVTPQITVPLDESADFVAVFEAK